MTLRSCLHPSVAINGGRRCGGPAGVAHAGRRDVLAHVGELGVVGEEADRDADVIGVRPNEERAGRRDADAAGSESDDGGHSLSTATERSMPSVPVTVTPRSVGISTTGSCGRCKRSGRGRSCRAYRVAKELTTEPAGCGSTTLGRAAGGWRPGDDLAGAADRREAKIGCAGSWSSCGCGPCDRGATVRGSPAAPTRCCWRGRPR